MKPPFCVVLTLILFLIIMPGIYAAGYDSYKPYLHKPTVPEHPNVKMYGAYSTNLFPGAATYSYSLEVPKGTNGLQPSLSLSYNSQSVKQRSGVIGAGWSLTENYVYRDANSTLSNTSDDFFTLVLNGNAQKLAYDAQYFGTLSNLTVGNEIYRYTYDQRYRAITEEVWLRKFWFNTGYTYDSMDQIIQKRLPNGTLSYLYNEQGLVDKIPSFVNGTHYNPFGNPLNRSFTNTKVSQFNYNALNGRLTGIDTDSIQNLDYTYDNVGNVKQINDVVNNRVQSMTYDYLDRLVNATINNSNYRYVYDETGNILKIIKDFNSSTRFGHTSSHVHAPSSVVDGNAGVMVYKINQLNEKDKNRTIEFYLVNEKNETLNNVNWTIDWGDSSATGSTISVNLSIGQNVMVIAGHTYANAGDFNISVRASYANYTDAPDEKAVKFGIKADALSLLNQNITNTTFEFKVRNDMAENANSINWSCDNGILSVTPFNLTGNQTIFIIIASNYSTPGGKALICNASSTNGYDSKSLAFNIKDVEVVDYNLTIVTGNKRLVNLMVKNYFSTQNVGYTFASDGQIFSGSSSIGSGNASVISQQINYTTPGTKYIISNISTAYTIDNRTESIVLKGLEISNYLLVNKTLTDKIIGYTIVNNWDNMSVNWTLSNPSLSSGTKINLSFNETLFVLIEENYTSSSTKDVNFTIFNGTISASFIDRFIVNIID
ncbi:MAG: SpvB/TcaC N-terminal domain-containing protein, partial [Candidatus Nanoarchaeia archaeon]